MRSRQPKTPAFQTRSALLRWQECRTGTRKGWWQDKGCRIGQPLAEGRFRGGDGHGLPLDYLHILSRRPRGIFVPQQEFNNTNGYTYIGIKILFPVPYCHVKHLQIISIAECRVDSALQEIKPIFMHFPTSTTTLVAKIPWLKLSGSFLQTNIFLYIDYTLLSHMAQFQSTLVHIIYIVQQKYWSHINFLITLLSLSV